MEFGIRPDQGEGRVKGDAGLSEADFSLTASSLTTLAQQQNLEVPSELQPEEQQMLEELQGADNQVQTYAQQQVTAHEKTVDLFQNYAEPGENEELKQLAEQTLPTLQ